MLSMHNFFCSRWNTVPDERIRQQQIIHKSDVTISCEKKKESGMPVKRNQEMGGGRPPDTLTLHNDGVLVERHRQLRRDLRRRRGPLEREREGPLPSACAPVRPRRVPPVQAVRPVVVVVPLEHGLFMTFLVSALWHFLLC